MPLVKKKDAFGSAQRNDAKSTKMRKAMRRVARAIQAQSAAHVRTDSWKLRIDEDRKLEARGLERQDTWQNAITALGTSRDKRVAGQFSTNRLIDLEAEDIWRGDDMGGRAVETAPNQIVRAGFEIQVKTPKNDASSTAAAKEKEQQKAKRLDYLRSNDGQRWWNAKIDSIDCAPEMKAMIRAKVRADLASAVFPPDATANEQESGKELSEQMNSQMDDLGVLDKVGDALKAERGYGGSALFPGIIDGVKDLSKPLNYDRIKSVDWLDVLTPLELVPYQWYDDATQANYGQPELYFMQRISIGNIGSTARIPIHESRLIRFPGLVVSRRQLREHWGWGDSVLVRMMEVLRDFQTSWQGAAHLMQDFSQGVMSIQGLAASFASGDPADANLLQTRAAAVDQGRSIARMIIMDAEEKFERQATPISGMPDMLDRFCNRLAAAAHMPVTLLMGQAPAGLNATGASDIRSWYDNVGANRERQLKPRLTTLAKMLFAAKEGPTGGEEPEHWTWKFGSLWQPTELEEAQRRYAVAQADALYITAGVLIPEEVAISRYGGDAYSAETHLDRDVREAFDAKAEEEAQAEADQMQQQAKTTAAAAMAEAKKPAPAAAPAIHIHAGGPAPAAKPGAAKAPAKLPAASAAKKDSLLAEIRLIRGEIEELERADDGWEEVERDEHGRWSGGGARAGHESRGSTEGGHGNRESGAVHSTSVSRINDTRQMSPAARKEALTRFVNEEAPTPTPEAPWRGMVKVAPGEDTSDKYMTDGKVNDPIRAELHEAIKEHFIGKDSLPPQGVRPKAIVMMGGSGSGKSSLLKDVDKSQFVHVDPDGIKEKFPEYRDGVAGKAMSSAGIVHEESSHVATELRDRTISEGRNIIYDGTGANKEKYGKFIDRLKGEGYDVELRFSHLPIEKAESRIKGRAEGSGRYVPPAAYQENHEKVPRNWQSFSQKADRATMFNTDVKRGEAPIKVWSVANGKDTHHDPDFVAAFKTRYGS